MDRHGIQIQLKVDFGNFLVVLGSDDRIDRLERESFHNFIDRGGHDDGVFVLLLLTSNN